MALEAAVQVHSEPKTVTVLGATGSIGGSTLDLIGAAPERFRVVALTANGNAEALAAAAIRLGARFAAVADPQAYTRLRQALAGSGVEAAAGRQAIVEAASLPAEWTMAAIVGAAGLQPTLAALRRGRTLALANKECLVCAGALFMAEARASGATLLPVDSEHNAIFQALAGDRRSQVEKLILTASGGPFREYSLEQMAVVTPSQAAAHPKWQMGVKISIDSATMMNKGLELIEAHHLFAMPEARIDVLVHPQSIVHSLVAFEDGSQLAQLGQPDMRIPIAYTLGWPERLPTTCARLDLAAVGQLAFFAPDETRFPALSLAREALRAGGAGPTVLNAANEVAVQAFLDGVIGFLDIAAVVRATLDTCACPQPTSLEAVAQADHMARQAAAEVIGRWQARRTG